MHKKIVFILIILLFLFSSQGHAQFEKSDPSLTWKVLRTDHFLIHYHDGIEPIANKVARIAESVHQKLTPYLNWFPESTSIVVNDRVDFVNAAATIIPRNAIILYVTPPSDISFLGQYDNWLALLIIHEYTHVLHLDQAFGFPASIRKIFGKNIDFPFIFSAFPQIFQPQWILEGFAIFKESDQDRMVGRLNSSRFKALMRLEVLNELRDISEINFRNRHLPVSASYLYGAFFFQFLQAKYGDEKITAWINDYGDNWFPYLLSTTSNNIFDRKGMNALWSDYQDYLYEIFQDEINDIRTQGVKEGKQLISGEKFHSSPRLLPNGDLYFLQIDRISTPKIMRLKSGQSELEIIAKITGTNASFDIHPEAGILLSQLGPFGNYNFFNDLYQISLDSGEANSNPIKRLTIGKRYRVAIWTPDGKGILAIQNKAGQSAIHQLDSQGNLVEILWEGNEDEVISTPSFSKNGHTIVASVWRPGGRWNLEAFDLETKQWHYLTKTKHVETTPQYSPDSNTIFFSADYDGVRNIYQLDLKSETVSKLTNVLGNAESPVVSDDGGQLFYTGTHELGTSIYQIEISGPTSGTPDRRPHDRFSITSIEASYPPAETFPEVNGTTEEYSPFKGLLPTYWTPILNFQKNKAEVGARTIIQDLLGWHYYGLNAAYDLENNWLVGDTFYVYDRFRPTLIARYGRDYVRFLRDIDTDSDARRFQRLSTYGFEVQYPWITLDSFAAFRVGALNVEQQLVDLGSQKTSDTELKLLEAKGGVVDGIVGLAFIYNSAKKFQLSISPSQGNTIVLIGENSDLFTSDFKGSVFSSDWRNYLTIIGKHVFASRLFLASGDEESRPFQLGGNTPSPVFSSGVDSFGEDFFGVRNQGLRGYPEGLASLRGNHARIFSFEWRYPLALVQRHYMSPPVGLDRLYGNVFVDYGDAYIDEFDGKTGIGAELAADIILGYFAPLTTTIGYAHGLSEEGISSFYIRVGGLL